jgi:hypothetical protein
MRSLLRRVWAALLGGTKKQTDWLNYAGQSYLDLIVRQLDEERQAKGSIEERAAASLTVSGALVTALLGLASGAVGSGFHLPDLSRGLVAEAILLLFGSSVFALRALTPRDYREVTPKWLESLLDRDLWQSKGWIGTREEAKALLPILRTARTVNKHKSWSLRVAYRCQAIGIALLALAILFLPPQ